MGPPLEMSDCSARLRIFMLEREKSSISDFRPNSNRSAADGNQHLNAYARKTPLLHLAAPCMLILKLEFGLIARYAAELTCIMWELEACEWSAATSLVALRIIVLPQATSHFDVLRRRFSCAARPQCWNSRLYSDLQPYKPVH